MNIYKEAWKLLYEKIDKKNSWGKIQLKNLILECLLDAEPDEKEKVNKHNSTSLGIKVEDDIPF